MPTLALDTLTAICARALSRAGASQPTADATARALVAADAQGLGSHGVTRLALYCDHLRAGRADGTVLPRVATAKDACCLVDAGGGLAFPAMDLALREVIDRAGRFGIAFAGVTNSHHCGAMALHLEPVAAAGMVGLGFSNSPAAINAWGGKRPLFGTNPVAAVFPRTHGRPLVIDLSLTEVARGKIMVYAKQGKPIPLGWALDRDGQPTTDAQAALTGSMFPLGGAKGAMLALVVELLCCALTGAAFGFENDSYFEPGGAPRIGHAVVAIDPTAMAGREVFGERVETLVAAMLADQGVRLPGSRRDAAAARAAEVGVELDQALHDQLLALAGPA